MSAMLKQKLIDIANGFTKYGLWKGGNSNLSELDDVTLKNLQTNDVLTYNGNEWVNDDNLQTQINTLNSNFVNCLKKSDVVNNLTTTTTNVPLSAAQGKVLNDKITNLSKSTTLLASISTNTVNPYALGASIKSYRYIYIKVIADGNTDTLFIQSSLCSNSEKHCYRCWGNDYYYVEGHIKFNSDTTVTVTQDIVKGWTGNPGSVLIYGINTPNNMIMILYIPLIIHQNQTM